MGLRNHTGIFFPDLQVVKKGNGHGTHQLRLTDDDDRGII